jgi:hypothetical protein
MLTKIHETEERKIISLCDEDLIGKKFETKDLQLDVSEFFYKGENLDEKKVLEEIEGASSLNIVGKDSIKFALKHNLISKTHIIKIQNIPHALAVVE